MIYAEPRLEAPDHSVLALIGNQRRRLQFLTQHTPRRWMGSLRRNAFARAIQGSNTIEGYNATIDEAIAAVEDEPPLDERTETWFALTGYRAALSYILQASQDPFFEFSKQFLKSLHFMMTGFDLDAYPGQWRPGAVNVVNGRTGEVVYEAPDVELVDPLVQELVDYLKAAEHDSSVIAAAMSHLNLTMVHPFKDGNGRMARALQTFVLARDGITHPAFASIEEWLGRNTDEYYRVLAHVGQGRWNPTRDALPWVRFCLKAHYQQSSTLIRRIDEAAELFDALSSLIERRGLNQRVGLPLFDCAMGLRLTNARYQRDAEVTQYVATRDLRMLAEGGLIVPHGEKRGRYYVAGDELRAMRDKVRRRKIVLDPYDLPEVKGEPGPRLPGL